MTNYKTLYSDIYNKLSDDDQTAFDSLNNELDKLHVTEDAKYEKLYNLITEMRKHNQDYIDYYGKKTTDLAKIEAKTLPKTRGNYWVDFSVLLFYFTVLYTAITVISGTITLSITLVIGLIMIFLMVPFMNHGIKHRASSRGNNQMLSTLIFLILFIITNLLVIFVNSEYLNAFKIASYDESIFESILFSFFVLVFVASLYFLITSKTMATRIIFIVLIIYSFGRIIYPFDFLNGVSDFIVKYFMFIGIIVIILFQYFRSKESKA
ncbi:MULTISPECIES: hypothetical protein [Jeotgalicoccus]|uniref:hypothetical protein n=1 Tax=Jeotgalicoccus TaxID=227979 RepID=UPI00042481D1|nr:MULTISPECIES: hypothetical protein [Jeotgalicoccus]